jgi:hypothetical protein
LSRTPLTWDIQTGKLAWVVQTGQERNDEFLSSSEEHYEISPDDAVMAVKGEKRGFTAQEARWLGKLLHVLTGYCIASTFWWHRGEALPPAEGKPTQTPPATPPSNPGGSKPAQAPDGAPVKVVEPDDKGTLFDDPAG